MDSCELCNSPGGVILWQTPDCRVVRVDDPDYPGFCRVIWQNHVREMTDLPAVDRHFLMDIVFAVEAVVRNLYAPDKINLASFGNMTSHVHWHVIPRWQDDRHFPQPVWGSSQRTTHADRPLISNETLSNQMADLLNPLAISRGNSL